MKLKATAKSWREANGPGHEDYTFPCPGCKSDHIICVKSGPNSNHNVEWEWNGSMESPTFSPSLLVRWKSWPTDDEQARILAGEKINLKENVCHSFIRNGQIQFLGDCTHELASKTVDMAEVTGG